MSTRRLNSVTRRCDHLHESGAGEVTLDFDEFGLYGFSRQRMFDEHHSPVGVACERITARHQPFDLQSAASTNGAPSVVWHATRFGVAHRHRP
jgi:hypothetical protein